MTTSSGNPGPDETTGPAKAGTGAKTHAPTGGSPSKQPPPPSTDTPLLTATQPTAVLPGVVYINYKRKKKRKYSSKLKSLQRVERGFSKSTHRLSRAVERGLLTYRKRRNKSSRRKKDGAIRDGLLNWSKAVGKTLRVASDAPSDLAREVNRTKLPRRFRNSLRVIMPPMFR